MSLTPKEICFQAENSSPSGLCELVDKIVCSDLGSHCLYELNVDTRDVSVIAGKLDDNGTDDDPVETATFNSPSGLALRGDVLYIAEPARCCQALYSCQGLQTSRQSGMGYLIQWEWFPKCLP